MNMMNETLHRAVARLPDHMQSGVVQYLENGLPPGGFLTAVLENDLSGAIARADATNIVYMDAWGQFLFALPRNCWGDPVTVQRWMQNGGWNGRQQNRERHA